MEAGGSEVQGCPQLKSKLEVRLGYGRHLKEEEMEEEAEEDTMEEEEMREETISRMTLGAL